MEPFFGKVAELGLQLYWKRTIASFVQFFENDALQSIFRPQLLMTFYINILRTQESKSTSRMVNNNISFPELLEYEMLCAIWYHLHNSKKSKKCSWRSVTYTNLPNRAKHHIWSFPQSALKRILWKMVAKSL